MCADLAKNVAAISANDWILCDLINLIEGFMFGPKRVMTGKDFLYFIWNGDEIVMVGEKNQSHIYKSLLWGWDSSLALTFTTTVSERERIIFVSSKHVFCLWLYLPVSAYPPSHARVFSAYSFSKCLPGGLPATEQKPMAWGLPLAMRAKVTQAEMNRGGEQLNSLHLYK